jgi:hypothetical protein
VTHKDLSESISDMAENELVTGAILTARAEEDRLKLWQILGVHASLESWQLEALVILSIWIVEARFGRGWQKNQASVQVLLPGKKEGEVRERKSERGCATASMGQLWHFRLLLFVPRDSSVKIVM